MGTHHDVDLYLEGVANFVVCTIGMGINAAAIGILCRQKTSSLFVKVVLKRPLCIKRVSSLLMNNTVTRLDSKKLMKDILTAEADSRLCLVFKDLKFNTKNEFGSL